MAQTGQRDNKYSYGEIKQPTWRRRIAVWMGVIIFVALIVTALIIVSRFLDKKTTDPVQFVTGNLLNALICLAILGQIYIYRQQAEIMKQNLKAFYIGEAPYFGASKIVFRWARGSDRTAYGDQVITRQPEVVITFMNGGKTPAWHFTAWPYLTLAGPADRKQIPLDVVHDLEYPDSENTFFPSAHQQSMKYRGEELTPVESNAINTGAQSLFLEITLRYTDMRHDFHTYTFRGHLNAKTGRFIHYGS